MIHPRFPLQPDAVRPEPVEGHDGLARQPAAPFDRLRANGARLGIVLALLVPAPSSATSPPALAIKPPPRIDAPRLVVPPTPGLAPIELAAVHVRAALMGREAMTEIEMHFHNPNPRVLEGELQFPLSPAQRVQGFALDINGELRDAVPVDKARGQMVFEEVIRGTIDPALLEVTQGNQFKLRVYPLPPKGTRRVVLRIAEATAGRYALPVGFGRVGMMTLDVQSPARPARAALAGVPLAYTQGRVLGEFPGFAGTAGSELVIEAAASAAPAVFTQLLEGRRYVVADVPVPVASAPRTPPRVVSIGWDSSGSRAEAAHERELALLDRYFQRLGDGEVWLTRIRHEAAPAERFVVTRGDWSALRAALAATEYDGASNLAAFRPHPAAKEALLFSDGLLTFGDESFASPAVPMYTISVSATGNAARLRQWAEATGGKLVDLTDGVDAAARVLLTATTRVAGVTSDDAAQLVLESPHPAAGRVRVAGVMREEQGVLTLSLVHPNGRRESQRVRLAGPDGRFAAARWAHMRIDQLDADADRHRAEIRRLSQRFGLVTRETSLIVLERIEDYARHEIVPPAPLIAEYQRLIAAGIARREADRAQHLAGIVRRFEEKVRWWQQEFPTERPAVAKIAGALAGVARQERDNLSPPPAREAAKREQRARADAPVMSMAAPAAPAMLVPQALAEAAAAPSAAGLPAAAIRLAKWQPNAPYVRRLREAVPADRYRVYLDEKPNHSASTAFYLDAADIFFDKGERALGLRILTNLAEMDLENRHILRILGNRLAQARSPALALPVFRRVLALAPDEPQSWRDLGLAQSAAGQPQEAIASLYEVVTRPWHNRFPDVEMIALAELNAIAAAHPLLDLTAIDPRLVKNLPLGLRAVLTWDADNTDIDLWVTDPDGVKSYYGHRLSWQGARMSADFTGGYGPEEFSLKRPKPGKYKVEANYYGDRRQNLTGATTLALTLSTGFGTPAQMDEAVTLRLAGRAEVVFVGEFTVQ